MYKEWEVTQVFGTQVTCCLDYHGLNMDAPSVMPAGAMNGWCWPTEKAFYRDLDEVEVKRKIRKAK